jgi:hypothetical protein
MCVVRVWCSGEGLLIRVVSLVDVGSAGFGPGVVVGHSGIATSKAHPTRLSDQRLEDPGHQFGTTRPGFVGNPIGEL